MYVNESKKFVFVKHNNRCQVLYRTRLFNLQDSVTDYYYDKIMRSFEKCVKSNINKNKFSPTAFIVWMNIYYERISYKAVWLNCSMTWSIWHFQILSHWHDDVVFKIVVSQNQSKQLTTMEKIYRKKERKRKQTKKQTK